MVLDSVFFQAEKISVIIGLALLKEKLKMSGENLYSLIGFTIIILQCLMLM